MQTAEIENTLDERSKHCLRAGFSVHHSKVCDMSFWGHSEQCCHSTALTRMFM